MDEFVLDESLPIPLFELVFPLEVVDLFIVVLLLLFDEEVDLLVDGMQIVKKK